MNSVKEIDIKNCMHYDMINIKNLDPNKIKIDRNQIKIFLLTTLREQIV